MHADTPDMSHVQWWRAQRGRRAWIGSSVAVALFGVAAAWSFTHCAALPEDRCIKDGIGPDVSFRDGCLICICDANGELHCTSRDCSPDAGLLGSTGNSELP